MREKRLVTFRMAPKKSNRKAKAVEILASGWKKCKLYEPDIVDLVEMRLLQSRAVIQWHSPEGEDRPYEGSNEIVLFRAYVERGFAVPTSDFFRGLLWHWGIQLHHLTPNSILHLAIFTHFCEAFLGIELHFDLFRYLFFLCPQPSANRIAEVGGAEVILLRGKEDEYLFYQPSGKGVEWKSF